MLKLRYFPSMFEEGNRCKVSHYWITQTDPIKFILITFIKHLLIFQVLVALILNMFCSRFPSVCVVTVSRRCSAANLLCLKAAEVSGLDGWSRQTPETPSSQQHWALAAGRRGREDHGVRKVNTIKPDSVLCETQSRNSFLFLYSCLHSASRANVGNC